MLVAVAEDDRLATNAVQHPLVVLTGLGCEALDIRARRAVDVEHALKLELRLERVQPALVGTQTGVAPGKCLDDLGPIDWRLPEPALAVAPDPRRIRQAA